MTKDTDLKKIMGERLTAARKAAGFRSRPDVIERFNFKKDTYASHEDGRRKLSRESAAKYADAFGTSVNHLLVLDLLNIRANATLNVPHDDAVQANAIPVYGQAAGGMWLEGDDMPFDYEPASVPAQPDFDARHQYARKVVGNSVSRHVADGEYAIFVRFDKYRRRLENGDLVDCRRTRAGLYEHTVKVFAGDRLMTDSKETETQSSIPLSNGEDETTVEILGVMIGAYRPIKNRYAAYNTR